MMADGRVAYADDGRLLIRDSDGEALELRPWLQSANVEGFGDEFFDELMAHAEDVLAGGVYEAGGPSFERIASVLPRVVDVTFVGNPRRDERFIVQPDGSVEGVLEPLAEVAPGELARHGRW